jgi:UDP-glucose 4-epimerase
MAARRTPKFGFPKDVVEVEGYVRGFARRRPDVTVTMLRNANAIGPRFVSPLVSYFSLPVIPKPLGFDARLQVIHYDDLLAALHHATLAGIAGTFNLAGEGVMMLSQAIRKLGRPAAPMPGFAINGLARALAPTGAVPIGFSAEQIRYLTYGRGLDTTRMRDVLGFRPAYTTEQAFEDFVRSIPPGLIAHHPVTAVESLVLGALGGGEGRG